MRRTHRRPLALIVATSLMALATAAPAQAKSVKITGKLKGTYASSVGSVIMLTANGRAVRGSLAANGKFTINTTSTKAKGATLQLIGKDNRYFGPIVLKTDKFKKRGKATRYFNHMVLSGKTLALGNVTVYNGWGKGVGNTKGYTKAFVNAVAANGKPTGAGKAGKVASSRPGTPSGYKPSGTSVSFRGAVAFANTTDPLATTSTGDPDGDGIPNALDVADSSTGILDIVNPDLGQSDPLIPWVDLRLSPSNAVNLHEAGATATETRDSVVSFIGGDTHNFNVVFYVPQSSINGSSDYKALDYAYVDCGTLAYCANADSATAYNEWANQDAVSWRTGGGLNFVDGGGSLPGDVPSAAGAPYNALYRMLKNDGYCPGGYCTYWTAGMQPRTGADTLALFKPGDIYTVHGLKGGVDTSVPMMLSAFAVTVPTKRTVELGALDAGAGTMTPDGAGTIKFTFWRPQRLAVPGEATEFMDLGGMNYGLILEQKNGSGGGSGKEFGCAPNFYTTTDSGLATRADYNANNLSDNLWPLVDATPLDQVPDTTEASTQYLTLELDLAGCLASIAADTTPKYTENGELRDGGTYSAATLTGVTAGTHDYRVSFTAAGRSLTGGANRAATDWNINGIVVP